MDAKQETLQILQKIGTKLQGLHEASVFDIGGFFVLLLFILMVLTLAVFACSHCCCTCAAGSRNKRSVI